MEDASFRASLFPRELPSRCIMGGQKTTGFIRSVMCGGCGGSKNLGAESARRKIEWKDNKAAAFIHRNWPRNRLALVGESAEWNINSRAAADACVSRLNMTRGGLNLKVELVSASPGLCKRVNNSQSGRMSASRGAISTCPEPCLCTGSHRFLLNVEIQLNQDGNIWSAPLFSPSRQLKGWRRRGLQWRLMINIQNERAQQYVISKYGGATCERAAV